MRRLFFSGLPAMAAALLLWTPAPAPAQTQQKPPAKPYSPKRLPDGHPDLQGNWQPNAIRQNVDMVGTGVDVPMLPAAQAVYDKRKAALGREDPEARCLPPGVPRVNSVGLFPIQIAQLPDQIIFMYEYMNVFRVVPLNKPHPVDLEPSYLGDSVGHWGGDTLVVDVTSFNDKTWLIGAGTFHSEKLHITERYRRVNKDRIDYEAVMEDPEVLTKPWVYRQTMMLREGTRLREYTCVENNLDPGRYEKLLKDGVSFDR